MARPKRQFHAALDSISSSREPVPVIGKAAREKPEPVYPVPPSRQGKVIISAYLPPQYKRTLKMLAAQTDDTQEGLIQKALDMLFTAQRIEPQ